MTTFRAHFPRAWEFHRGTSHAADAPLVGSGATAPGPAREMLDVPSVRLPAPSAVAGDLGALLASRYSCRRFTAAPLSLDHLGQLLFAAYGIQGRSVFGGLEFLERPVPSAGGLYPLEMYVLAPRIEGVPAGVYHYAVIGHLLEQVQEGLPAAQELEHVLLDQAWLSAAPALVVVTAVVARLLPKYGERGYRYLHLEAGHVVQNVDLAALAYGLGTCNVGGFLDHEVGELLHLDEEQEIPLYAVAVGHPVGGERASLRSLDEGEAPGSRPRL